MSRAGEITEQQRQTWDRSSPGWIKWDTLVLKMLAPVGAEMIRALAPREGSEHLGIASGTGEPGPSIAAVVPRGRVVLTDLSGGMLAAAGPRTRGRGTGRRRRRGTRSHPGHGAGQDPNLRERRSATAAAARAVHNRHQMTWQCPRRPGEDSNTINHRVTNARQAKE